MMEPEGDLKKTPLHDLHVELGARMVPFAGYAMPVQYPAGIIAEHQHCRSEAALFDVSHMGQIEVGGPGSVEFLESLLPADLRALAVLRTRYSFFTNETGGILDDLMITRIAEDELLLVVNAARKHDDLAHLQAHNTRGVEVSARFEDLALIALQGPKAAEVLGRAAPLLLQLPFMSATYCELYGAACRVARLGYTGEDGYEISLSAAEVEVLARRLLAEPEVRPAGLGARDSLRLEAGLCLYGHDIDETTSPIEAGLAWAISKRRREEGGYPGAETIKRQLASGTERRFVGIRPLGRAPVREGAALLTSAGTVVGRVTSGGFGPTVGGPIALGYLATSEASKETKLLAEVRGKQVPVEVTAPGFVEKRYFTKIKS